MAGRKTADISPDILKDRGSAPRGRIAQDFPEEPENF
jgi:hypothetical protein